MKLFGTLSELVAIVFRKDTRAITLRPNQATTYLASTDVQLAPTADTTQTLVEIDATQTLTNKTFTSPTLTAPTSTDGSFTSVDTFSLDDTDSAFNTAIQSTSTNTANRTLTLDVDDGSRVLELSGDLRVVGGFSTTLTETGSTNVTLPLTGTLATLAGSESLTNKTLPNVTITGASTTIQEGMAIVDTADATKRLQFDVGGTTGTFTSLLTAQTTNRTLTLPDATDTLVGKATTDALTNKTFTGATNSFTVRDNLFTIQDDADPTKQAVFQASGITTGTTRTFTFPDASGTLLTGASAVFSDTAFTIQDDGDATKQLKFQVSGVTTGTTRTLTVPNASDTIAVLGTAQTFTAAQTNSSSLTMSSATAGQLAFTGAANAVVNINEGINFAIDADNGQADREFRVSHNATDGTGQVVFSVAENGNSSIGATVTGNSTGGLHTINGGLTAGNVTSTDASGEIVLGSNVRVSADNAEAQRTNTTTGGTGIVLANRTSDSASAIVFSANLAGAATTTGAATIGSASQAGMWGVGPSAVANNFAGPAHKIYGGLAAGSVNSGSQSGQFPIGSNAYLNTNISNNGRTQTAPGGALFIMDNPTTAAGEAFGFYTNQPADTTTTAATEIGFATIAGAWTFGKTTAQNVTHILQNNSTTNRPATIKNNSTSTSSDALGCAAINKGSSTTTAGSNYFFEFTAGAQDMGRIASNGANSSAFFNSSDRRLKKDIADLTGALDTVLAMRPVTYKWKSDDSVATGFIAQELVEVLPKAVCTTDSGEGDTLPEGVAAWAMTEGGFAPYLVAAIQALKAENDAMRARLDALEA